MHNVLCLLLCPLQGEIEEVAGRTEEIRPLHSQRQRSGVSHIGYELLHLAAQYLHEPERLVKSEFMFLY